MKWNLILNTLKVQINYKTTVDLILIKYLIKIIIFFSPDYLICILTLKQKVLSRNLDLDLALITWLFTKEASICSRVPKTCLSWTTRGSDLACQHWALVCQKLGGQYDQDDEHHLQAVNHRILCSGIYSSILLIQGGGGVWYIDRYLW